jgi:hypothetical protein
MTLVTKRSVRGSTISFPSPFPQTKLTDGYAGIGNMGRHSTYIAREDGREPISGAQCRR